MLRGQRLQRGNLSRPGVSPAPRTDYTCLSGGPMGGFLENRGHPEVSPCLLDRRSRALTVCVKPVGGGGGLFWGPR